MFCKEEDLVHNVCWKLHSHTYTTHVPHEDTSVIVQFPGSP